MNKQDFIKFIEDNVDDNQDIFIFDGGEPPTAYGRLFSLTSFPSASNRVYLQGDD